MSDITIKLDLWSKNSMNGFYEIDFLPYNLSANQFAPWCLNHRQPSLHSRKFNPNPKFLGTAEAHFVCHIGPIFRYFWFMPSLDVCSPWSKLSGQPNILLGSGPSFFCLQFVAIKKRRGQAEEQKSPDPVFCNLFFAPNILHPVFLSP